MKKYQVEEIAEMIGGVITKKINDKYADNVFIDSRLGKPNGIFFALSGTTTNGHKYLNQAVENGAVIVVVSEECDCNANMIKVNDTFKALQNLAKAYRNKFDIPYVAVTGSSGKTTTKDLIACVLAQKYNVHKTKGNFNSSTGVPLTLFDLCDENEISVIETSMNAPGEILGNMDIVRPNTAVITNVGTAHIEFLGSRENIFKAKCEILTYLQKGDCAIVNADDDMLCTLSSDVYEIIKVGSSSECTLTAYDIEQNADGISFYVDINDKAYKFEFKYPGMHNVLNCLSAIAVGLRYSLSPEQIQKGLLAFIPGNNRMQIEEVSGMTLINDAYNANESSFKAAIDFLCTKAKGRKVVVASDMYELGEYSSQIHFKTGENAAKLGVDLLIACGENAENYKTGYLSCGGKECIIYNSKEELTNNLKKHLRIGDTVLFKASRGVKLEEVFNRIKETI